MTKQHFWRAAKHVCTAVELRALALDASGVPARHIASRLKMTQDEAAALLHAAAAKVCDAMDQA